MTRPEAGPEAEPASARRWPAVSVVMPVRDDAAHLPGAVAAVLAQQYPGELEVVLGVGPSSDGTEAVARQLAGADPRVKVVPNPKGITSAGLNVAIGTSTGEVVVRVDGHCELSDGYIRTAVESLEATGADNVGGVQRAEGETVFERAVAAAMTSRFGVGNARFHYGGPPGPADTVYLGVFRRAALERVGGFDESLVRNQDYELNWRLRDTGGVVWFEPRLWVRYRPRPTLRRLGRQYFEYGQWKREMLRRHPRSLRLRQAIPPAALVVNAAGLVLGAVVSPRWLAAPAVYAAAVLVASALAGRGDPGVTVRLPAVFATMHGAWGLGFLVGPRHRSRSRAMGTFGRG